jgi:uncharacterized RDD family membrane protein YckC
MDTASRRERVAFGKAEFAGFGRRLAATMIDWTIFWTASSLLLPALLFVPISNFFVVAYPAISLGGFAWLWTRFRTPGMAALRYRLVDAATGKPPRLRRLVPRAVAALILYADVAVAGFSPWLLADEDSTAWLLVVIAGVLAVSLVAVGTYLWMLWDPRRQTLVDKLCAVVALRDPWPDGTIWPPESGTTPVPGRTGS